MVKSKKDFNLNAFLDGNLKKYEEIKAQVGERKADALLKEGETRGEIFHFYFLPDIFKNGLLRAFEASTFSNQSITAKKDWKYYALVKDTAIVEKEFNEFFSRDDGIRFSVIYAREIPTRREGEISPWDIVQEHLDRLVPILENQEWNIRAEYIDDHLTLEASYYCIFTDEILRLVLENFNHLCAEIKILEPTS